MATDAARDNAGMPSQHLPNDKSRRESRDADRRVMLNEAKHLDQDKDVMLSEAKHLDPDPVWWRFFATLRMT